jgi:splicing factor 1
VLIQGDTEDNIKKAVELISPLLDPYSDPERRGTQMLQIAVTSVLRDQNCDNCGEKGHKTWDCPSKLGSGFKKPEIICSICKDRSHPSYDCPLKRCNHNNI